MNGIANLIWLIFGGLVGALLWMTAGLLLCATIVGIPFGLQALKIAGFVLWPFGRDVEVGAFGVGGAVGNVLWILLFGWELALAHVLAAVIFTVTIIGIPFARQHIKLARLSLLPFGATIRMDA